MTEPAAEIRSIDSPTDLAQSFDSLEIESSNSTENEEPETASPNAMAAGDQGDVGFLSLPREVRDQIYLNLVVAEDPIQYSEKFESLSRSGTFADTALKWMFDVESNFRIAEETREIFYQHNTFLVYTHDIPALLHGKTHAMLFAPGKDSETTITYSTPFDAGAWVRKLAVRVGWHASGGWFTDSCCCYPASDLRLLLQRASLRSVIIDARFGAWSYGIPQGIGWDLLEEMRTKWGKEFRLYNDQTLGGDTRRYTIDRTDLSDILLPRSRSSENGDRAETASDRSEQEEINEDGEAEEPENAETVAESEDEEREENSDEEEDYWERQEAARSVTSEVQAGEGSDEDGRETWSGDEPAQGAWSMGENLIILAGERLIQSERTGERWEAEYW